MLEKNVPRVLQRLSASDVVLDIGGWACPFNRANYVLDAEPFETRGYYASIGRPASQGGEAECFSEATWIRRDICDKAPFPFADKAIDYVICSHVLEDIRDPIFVCSEMLRVAKRGYIEVPSRISETCRGSESLRSVGLTHHRWLIDLDEQRRHLSFLMKHHMIHSSRRFSFPPSFRRQLTAEDEVHCLFWDDEFSFGEVTIHGLQAIASELETYVSSKYRYTPMTLTFDRATQFVRAQVDRVSRRLGR